MGCLKTYLRLVSPMGKAVFIVVLFCYLDSSDKVQDKIILKHALQKPMSGIGEGRGIHKLLESMFFAVKTDTNSSSCQNEN